MKGSPIQLLARKTVTKFRAVDFRIHVTTCSLYGRLRSLGYSRARTQTGLKSSLQRPHLRAASRLQIQGEKAIWVEVKGCFIRLLHQSYLNTRHSSAGPLLPVGTTWSRVGISGRTTCGFRFTTRGQSNWALEEGSQTS